MIAMLPSFTQRVCSLRPLHCRACRLAPSQFAAVLSLTHTMPEKGIKVCPFEVKLSDVIKPTEATAAELEAWHRLWHRLHLAAVRGELTEAVLDEIAAGLTTCACLADYRAWRVSHPLPTSAGPEEQFGWTWELHEEVNRKLGKPRQTRHASWDQWSRLAAVEAPGVDARSSPV
jgi:hypothetical protein